MDIKLNQVHLFIPLFAVFNLHENHVHEGVNGKITDVNFDLRAKKSD